MIELAPITTLPRTTPKPRRLTMKAFLINPFERVIVEVEYDGNWRSIKKLISHEEHQVSLFTAVQINEEQDTIYVDDEGLLKLPTMFFEHKDCPQPLAGCGLVLGTDDEGDSITPKVTLEELTEAITFLTTEEVARRVGVRPQIVRII